MSIQYAILGLLSWRSVSGYDLKKIIAASPVMYWSGSNNQIYRSLVELHTQGLVTQEVQPQENYPDRKVYTITEQGRAALRAWALAEPEPVDLHHTFLVQLMWAAELEPRALDDLLARYAAEVELQLAMLRKNRARRANPQPRSAREAFVWDMIWENQIGYYEGELTWVNQVRSGINEDGERNT